MLTASVRTSTSRLGSREKRGGWGGLILTANLFVLLSHTHATAILVVLT